MDKQLNRENILAAQDLPYRDIVVPEWGGGTVRVCGLTASAALSFSSKMVKLDEKGNVKALTMDNFMPELLVLTLVNENNELLFGPEDVDALGKKSAAVLKRLFEAAMELSGLGDEAKQEAAKN